jgi:ATP-binding cassette subfamily B protein
MESLPAQSASAPELRRALRRTIGLLDPERRVTGLLASAGIVTGSLQVAEPLLFGQAVNALATGRDSLAFVVLWGLTSFSVFASSLVISVLADRLAHRRRVAAMEQFLGHVLALPASFHTKSHAGRLMRVMTTGCDTLFSVWLATLRDQVSNSAALVILLPLALYLNWRLALLLAILLGIYAAINLLVILNTSTQQSKVEDQFLTFSGHAGDLVGNVTVLQSFLAVALEMRAVRSSLDQLLATQYPVLNWWAASSVLTRGASSLSIVLIFAFGAMLAAQGNASIGDIVAFIGFTTLLIGRLDQLTSFAMALFMKAPALAQFFAILDERPEIVEKPDAIPLTVREGHVVFDNVTFRYPRGSGGVADLNFEARPGETVAIVGATGSGKSTALALLTRAYDPEEGRILVDGIDIRDVTLSSLRAAIGVVFQDPALFSRSIAENIAIGRPGASMEEIEAAARAAGAIDFILRKEHGFDTVLGERGQGLSGGERQRIAIARAILKDAPLLILDEATSALDPATETRIQVALDGLRAGRTTFVIAHRLATIRGADKIILLEQGCVAETGTFEELSRKGGKFAEMLSHGSGAF